MIAVNSLELVLIYIFSVLFMVLVGQILLAIMNLMHRAGLSFWRASLEVLSDLFFNLFQYVVFIIFVLAIIIGPELLIKLLG